MHKKLIRIFLKKDFKLSHLVCLFALSCVIALTSCKTEQVAEGEAYIDSINHEAISLSNASSVTISSEDRVYYLVRHAEKDTVGKDPDLTPDGYARAGKLAKIFKAARVDEVYSTMYMRTLMTADSISKSKGMPMKTYDPKSLKVFAERLKNIEDQKRFVIVGHSNTTPALANHIHGKEVLKDFDEKDYDNLIVVIQSKDKESQLHQLKFKP